MRSMSGRGPVGVIFKGAWQSLHPPIVTRYRPRSIRDTVCCSDLADGSAETAPGRPKYHPPAATAARPRVATSPRRRAARGPFFFASVVFAIVASLHLLEGESSPVLP